METERRSFSRVQLPLEVSLVFDDGECVVGPCRDLSLNGVGIALSAPLAAGTVCMVTLKLGELLISARGVVARATGEVAGLQLTEIEIESFYHLRQILLLNASEPEVVAGELAQAVGLKRKS